MAVCEWVCVHPVHRVKHGMLGLSDLNSHLPSIPPRAVGPSVLTPDPVAASTRDPADLRALGSPADFLAH